MVGPFNDRNVIVVGCFSEPAVKGAMQGWPDLLLIDCYLFNVCTVMECLMVQALNLGIHKMVFMVRMNKV